MIIVQIAGGLGNQMQQYALYRKFLSLGKEAKIDVSWYGEAGHADSAGTTGRQLELRLLEGISWEACTAAERDALTGGDSIFGKLRRKLLPGTIHWFQESGMYHPEVFEQDHLYLTGYFACEKYYADILPRLREEIRFPEGKNPENQRLAKEMQERNSVSVHIRRGDYLNEYNAAMFGNICTEAYYQGAMDYFKKQDENVHFYLFSDEPDYVRAHYQGDCYTVVDVNHGTDSFLDMWLMSRCRHNICANSTFSFWGARLNTHAEKIMIRPTIHKNSQTFVKEQMQKLWPGWMFVDPAGAVR